MAPNSTSKATPKATLDKTSAACHRHWNWLADGAERNIDAQFAAKTLDISRGCQTIGTILCQHLVDLAAMKDDDDTRPLLNTGDTEALARLMVVALEHLHYFADVQVERFNKAAREGARA